MSHEHKHALLDLVKSYGYIGQCPSCRGYPLLVAILQEMSEMHGEDDTFWVKTMKTANILSIFFVKK